MTTDAPSRPKSITFVAVLSALSGVSRVLTAALIADTGAQLVLLGTIPPPTVAAGCTFLLGAAGIAAAIGLWHLREWGWHIAIGLEVYGLVSSLLNFPAAKLVLEHQVGRPLDDATARMPLLIAAGIALAAHGLIFGLLIRRRDAFVPPINEPSA